MRRLQLVITVVFICRMSRSCLMVLPMNTCALYTIELIDEVRMYVLTVILIYAVTCLPQEAQVLEFGQKTFTSVGNLVGIYLWAFVVGVRTPDRMTVPVLTKIVTVFINRIEEKGV